MAVSYEQVRQFALALPNVSEGRVYGGPSLHVGRKFLGRLREDNETLVLKIDLAERASLLKNDPDAFFLEDHYRQYPFILVNLLAVKPKILRRLIEQAWRMVASKRTISAYDSSEGHKNKQRREMKL
jgi:hypothetical protein